jgi:hypothetical protein
VPPEELILKEASNLHGGRGNTKQSWGKTEQSWDERRKIILVHR